MTSTSAPRLPVFSRGKLLAKDIGSKYIQRVSYESDDVKQTFEKVKISNFEWVSDGVRKTNGDIIALINGAGLMYGTDVAVVEIQVRDPYLPNPTMTVLHTFRYGVIYHDKKCKNFKVNTVAPESKDCRVGRMGGRRAVCIEILPIDNDKPFTKLSQL